MKKMKVYAHYVKINGIEYRWKTLLQLGNSWEVCGTVIMKNPGSSHPRNWNNDKPIPINNIEILKNLNRFDDFNSLDSKEWFDFSVDPTMRHVGNLIEAYLRYNKQKEEGIIQIFNLFNVIDKSLGEAIQNFDPQVVNTIEDDINSIKKYSKYPIYIGWGTLWKNEQFRENAERIYNVTKEVTHYLNTNGIDNNKYYHPQYLLGVGKNQLQCRKDYFNFIGKRFDASDLESIIKEEKAKQLDIKYRVSILKEMIFKAGEKQAIYKGTVFYNEFYTTIRNGKYVPSKDTIAIDLLFEDNDCVIRLCTRRYDSEKAKEIAVAVDGVFMPGNTNLTAPHWHVHAKMPQSTSNDEIALNLNAFLDKVKAYRDKEYPLTAQNT